MGRELPFFKYNEKPGNIFEYEQEYDLVICADSDFNLDKRMSIFNKRYKIDAGNCPHGAWNGVGYCTQFPHIFMLIVEFRWIDDINLDRLREALYDMREKVLAQGVRKLVMPRWKLGNEWGEVKDILFEVFGNYDIEILAVYPPQEEGLLIIMDPDLEKQNFGKDRKELSKKYY